VHRRPACKTVATCFYGKRSRRKDRPSTVFSLHMFYYLRCGTYHDDFMTDEKKDEEKRLTPKDYWMSDSFGEMRRLLDTFRANMEETLERVFPSQASLPALKQPRVDILDLGDALQVVADMPGVRKEDIEINLKPERVEISADSSTETERKEEDYTYRERGYASYRRVIDLPADVLPDKAEASFKNGVLEVNLPKKEPTEVEKTTRVQIK